MSKLSDTDVEELLYLVHDKDHVGGSRADLRGLNHALRIMSTPAPVVYRGITSEELRHIRDSQNSFVPKGYTSATEDLTVAKKFADSYKTKTVLVMEGFLGFCYWRWLRDWFLALKKNDEEEYESTDGDFMIESAEEESEWIFSRIVFHVAREENKGGFTFLHVRPGSVTHAAMASLRQLLVAEERFEEREHPRRTNGEFAPKISSDEPKTEKRTRAHSLTVAHEDRDKWPAHIRELKLPPGWTNVRYSDDPHADLLALGKDKKGRDQYVYHEKFAKSQAAMKFARIHELDSKFDAIRDQVAKARRSRDSAIRDVADCVHLIMSTGLRPGSEDDTKADKRAYGASTLEGRHVVVKKGEVRLRFVGKKGVDIDVPVDDPEAAALLKRRAKEAGADGQLFPKASASALLDFVHDLDGGSFKTKDMRTLKGTRTARELVSIMDAPKNEAEYRKAVLAVAKHVSSVLGNTPAVALAAYISPVVFASWKGGEVDAHREEASVSKKPLPGVRFGKKGLPNWRVAKKTAGRDDDVPRPVDKSTKRMLGFDPHARARTKEHSAIQGRPNHHGDVHAELVKMLSAIKFWLHRKLSNDPSYLDRRDLDVNISQITGDHHYSSLMLKLTSNSDPRGAYALAKKIGALTYIIMFDCTSGKYAKWQPEFYESPVFTELLAHELTHQLQNLNDADHLLGTRDVRSTVNLTAADYYNHPREVQAWTMGAVTRFTQHAKVRSVDAFWEWAKKQDLYSGWVRNASPKSLEIARRIVSEVLAPK